MKFINFTLLIISLLFINFTVAEDFADSYTVNRCRRKLATVKWRRYKDGWTTPLNTDVVYRYCKLGSCLVAYDDKDYNSSSRAGYWNTCKNNILNEFASYYKAAFEVVSSTVNYY